MKKISTILLTLIIALAMMPVGVFADNYFCRARGADKPTIQNIEEWVIDCKDDGANAVYYDNPVFETDYMFDILDQETETLSGNMAPIRPKMDCDIEVSISSNYPGKIYLAAWSVEQQNSQNVAVNRAESIKAGSPSIALPNIKNNEKIMLIISLCDDFSAQQLGSYEIKLNATATPTGDKPAKKCVHVPIKVDREEPFCGYNGSKAHWVCEDCWTWLIKDKATGEFRKMTKAEKKAKTLKMPAKKHSFTKKVRNAETRIRKASCLRAAKYYYTCETCGIIGGKTFTYGKKLGHNYKKNHTIPATQYEEGKVGTICTRCNKVKKGTETKTIPMIEELMLNANPWCVGPNATPDFTVTLNGEILKPKYYDVNIEDLGDEMVMATAVLKNRYKGTAICIYFQLDHEPTDREKAKLEKMLGQL